MTPDEPGYDARRIDGLMSTTTRHDERLTGLKEDLIEIRDDLRKDITKVSDECKAFREEYRKDRREALERSSASRASNRMVVVAMIGGSATVFAAIVAAVAAIVTGGP